MVNCSHCSRLMSWDGLPPPGPGDHSFCGYECKEAWDADHPDEAAEWIPVEQLTTEQRAELAAICGRGVSC